MRLWSYHAEDVSLTEGRVDPSRSEFARQFRAAYEELWRRVRTDQLVWCFVARDPWAGRVEWELEVPRERFLRIVNNWVWAGIRGEHAGEIMLPDHWRFQMQTEALRRFPDSPGDQARWYDGEAEKLLRPPGQCPWDALFVTDVDPASTSVLLDHPIDARWVLARHPVPWEVLRHPRQSSR
jgi:hypothetical protein